MYSEMSSPNRQPFIKLFRSPRQFYIYSVNRNSIECVSENVYRYLAGEDISLSPAGKTELLSLSNDGFLSSCRIKTIKHPAIKNIENIVDNRMEQLVLQVTQSCNLVCSYCPYANKTDGKLQRNHTSKCMSFDMAKKAVDFFLEHSNERSKNVISFYGGEPLIAFDLIKQIVEYAKERFLGKDISFNMTTNATLFTDEIMDFIIKNRFDIVFSIDGPAKIHDVNRKKADGTGSFADAFNSLKELINRYGDGNLKHISLNMVFDPVNDIDDVLKLFDDPIFEKGINVNADVADDSQLEKTIKKTGTYIEKMSYQYFLGYLDLLRIIDGLKIAPFIKSALAGSEKDYAKLRNGGSELPEESAPGGPCIPGQRRLFVTVDGDFFPCEKVSEISEPMKIGNIKKGLNIKKMVSLLDIANLTPAECKNCWALLHCFLCAQFADNNGSLSREKRLSYCNSVLDNATTIIKEFILTQECKTLYKRGK